MKARQKLSLPALLLSPLCLLALLLGLIFLASRLFADSDRAESFDGIQIAGSARYCDQVREALQLLKNRDASDYAIVTTYVKRIEEGPHSGMWAYRDPPTFEMSDVSAFSSVTWCAADIAHDSYHSKLYHDYRNAHGGYVPDDVWKGREAEQKCMKHQLAAMERIKAPQPEMDWARQNADGHYVKDNEDWQDFEKNDW